jgi:LacI family transcriptional regulator
MPTIRDVARLAGVAPITASRVINNSGYSSESVRARVRQAAGELGYVPNSLARSLRSKQTRLLALVITDVTNPFWTTVARGVEDAAHSAGFNLILCNTDESESKQEQYLETLIQKQVDGILLVPARDKISQGELLRQQKIPIVVLDRRIPGVKADVVRCDSEEGAYQLVHTLLVSGHRQIACLCGPAGVSSAEDRLSGYRRALRAAGIEENQELIHQGAFSLESGYTMTNDLIKIKPRPTALFASNNFLAIGALRALNDAGISVPQQMSVVGFDDLPDGLIVQPFLTAAVQPAYAMGYQGAQQLIDRLTGTCQCDGFQEIILPIVIVQRESARAI